jgi:hypothetical protein
MADSANLGASLSKSRHGISLEVGELGSTGRAGVKPRLTYSRQKSLSSDRGAGDRTMAEPSLDSPLVVALVFEGITAGMRSILRMGLQFEASGIGGALYHAGEAGRREWRPALADEDKG